MAFLTSAVVSFLAFFVAVPFFMGVCRVFNLYTTIFECRARVYTLFGKVVGVLDEPGLQIPFFKFGPRALLIPLFGKVYEVDMRLDQRYLRSQPVNTEEGTPMGIGVWYETRICHPVDFLFQNTDPEGSLVANVANATVRCLSNLPLSDMLINRHSMSRVVRQEVSPKSESWGFSLGSVYIRKVHFRDQHMIDQIEQKVVNRLRQVTSAIRQAGANEVDIITSRAEKEAAIEFARAKAVRPRLVGEALDKIARDKDVLEALFQILETSRLVEGENDLTLLSHLGGDARLGEMVAAFER